MSSVTGLNPLRTLSPAFASEHAASIADTPSARARVESKDALKAARTNDLVGRMVISLIAGCRGQTTLDRDLDSEMNEEGDRHGAEINPS